MLENIKLYFNIASTDTSKDAIINLIIDNVKDLQAALGFDSSCNFACCVEDFSAWLKSGNTAYTTAQVTEGISRYSTSLQAILKASMKAHVF